MTQITQEEWDRQNLPFLTPEELARMNASKLRHEIEAYEYGVKRNYADSDYAARVKRGLELLRAERALRDANRNLKSERERISRLRARQRAAEQAARAVVYGA